MDWNPDGPNVVEIPEGVTAHDIGVMPVIQLVKRDDEASGRCPDCRKRRDQMRLVPKILTGIPTKGHIEGGQLVVDATRSTVTRLRFKDEGVTGAVEIAGDALKLPDPMPDDLLVTHVRVYYRPRDEVVLTQGVKWANRRHHDPLDPYRRSQWEGPIAEFEISGGMERAAAFLEAHNAQLLHDHAAFSKHEAHADVVLEVEG